MKILLTMALLTLTNLALADNPIVVQCSERMQPQHLELAPQCRRGSGEVGTGLSGGPVVAGAAPATNERVCITSDTQFTSSSLFRLQDGVYVPVMQ